MQMLRTLREHHDSLTLMSSALHLTRLRLRQSSSSIVHIPINDNHEQEDDARAAADASGDGDMLRSMAVIPRMKILMLLMLQPLPEIVSSDQLCLIR